MDTQTSFIHFPRFRSSFSSSLQEWLQITRRDKILRNTEQDIWIILYFNVTKYSTNFNF